MARYLDDEADPEETMRELQEGDEDEDSGAEGFISSNDDNDPEAVDLYRSANKRARRAPKRRAGSASSARKNRPKRRKLISDSEEEEAATEEGPSRSSDNDEVRRNDEEPEVQDAEVQERTDEDEGTPRNFAKLNAKAQRSEGREKFVAPHVAALDLMAVKRLAAHYRQDDRWSKFLCSWPWFAALLRVATETEMRLLTSLLAAFAFDVLPTELVQRAVAAMDDFPSEAIDVIMQRRKRVAAPRRTHRSILARILEYLRANLSAVMVHRCMFSHKKQTSNEEPKQEKGGILQIQDERIHFVAGYATGQLKRQGQVFSYTDLQSRSWKLDVFALAALVDAIADTDLADPDAVDDDAPVTLHWLPPAVRVLIWRLAGTPVFYAGEPAKRSQGVKQYFQPKS